MPQRYEIKGFDQKGRGLGTGAGTGETLNIPFTYPGDIVEAELLNKHKKTGRLINILEPSPDRQTPPCPHFAKCGGCSWHGLTYEAQLKHKAERVRNLFGEAGQIIPSPDLYHYRNRMDYAFGPDYSIGLKDRNNYIVDIEKCSLMSEESVAIMDRLRYFIRFKKLVAHREGIMRHVIIREGKNIKNTILNILTSDKDRFPLEEFWEKMQDLVQGVTWAINLSPADRSYGDIQQTFGQDYYMESLHGIKFKVPVQSFFQTNVKQAEKLLDIVKDFADLQRGETLLDLYSGTGSIGLSLADRAKEVVGVEENEPATELSKENARLNGINNFSALAGRAEKVIGSLEGKFDTIIMDPPRPGVHKNVLRKLGETRPAKIVYVSCNPFTQKYDAEKLKEFGYKIERCQPLDMFPHTPHMENVILLTL
ncbi:23S rRNA (uracil-5-)-methyltransferase RumA [candidate division WOR-1 bacterium RIFOXYB2_FULL_42_35]|uniref:23S rRNA (Uracil-5-)-methyltransferase RumA n=1 Tax=candidate division WOR-1 bacterium RIFOXYC2_FULL_41_25 TaxID=1802586 RepID=A0A1F4TK91_UNCSA|nr:MAG: 23S rRNA (uracil-5-)-methyltransferase RumA [candidate division WOR-1 bacterium RIFOXYA2_FULL_41_14]OGC22425.1 MAG: 23S rRNA (uracil-5-)-methyltransferase RumA [candidate division WOR-1 bacterium RIFOXYB2_FULL_42_35]OGC33104.1 MAG: 23S rRNA (uracil-5-)-methyltransferase RumA [candidate division WOR-1 bacterium RIFOXYC2_FULL_41_25]